MSQQNRPWRRRGGNPGGGGGGGHRGRWYRNRGSSSNYGGYNNYRAEGAEGSYGPSSSSSSQSQSSDLPGFVWDEQRRRYFRQPSDQPGAVHSAGAWQYSPAGLAWERREQERMARFSSKRDNLPLEEGGKSEALDGLSDRPEMSMPTLLARRQLGIGDLAMKRRTAEMRLRSVGQTPVATAKVLPHGHEPLAGCQFLDVSRDGRKVVGSWAVSNSQAVGGGGRHGSRIMCLMVENGGQERTRRRQGKRFDGQQQASEDDAVVGEGLSLTFSATPNYIYALDPSLVDMCTAPVDSDVTCVLYVTASAALNRQTVSTCCRVFMQPVPELSAVDTGDILNSPVYNIHYTVQEAVWSCAWNAHTMRIGLGMEDNALLVDIIAETNLRVSSRHKNVLSQEFSQTGQLLYMGLRGHEMQCCDLRQHSHHITASYAQTSVGWIRLLRSDPNYLLAENFHGQLKLWDVRNRRALISFAGHRNSHYRLSCAVDDAEKLLFAVGEDGTTRGWSLRTAALLCSVPSARPVQQRADFPRVCYSDCWAGVAGQAALVLAVEDELRVHQLHL